MIEPKQFHENLPLLKSLIDFREPSKIAPLNHSQHLFDKQYFAFEAEGELMFQCEYFKQNNEDKLQKLPKNFSQNFLYH